MVANSTIVISTPTMTSPRPGTPWRLRRAKTRREHAVVGRGLGGLAHEQHPAAERPTDLRIAQTLMMTTPQVPTASRAASAKGACDFCSSCVRDDAHDDRRAQHVDDRREAEADERGQRDVALRVLDHARRDGRALDAHVGPERHRGGARDGMHVGAAAHVPAREERRRCRTRTSRRTRCRGSGSRARLMVQVSSAPTTRGPRMLANVRSQITAGGGEHARRRAADRGDELREVAHRRDRDRDVADPVAEPVDVVGLEARHRGRGNRARRRRARPPADRARPAWRRRGRARRRPRWR